MTILTLDSEGMGELANAVDRIPASDFADAESLSDARILTREMRRCILYGRTRVHITLEPDEDSFLEHQPERQRDTGQQSDLSLVLELAERFLDEGALADDTEAARHPYRVAIARLRKTTPDLTA